jgi:thiamine biosynthesis protein ThiS
MIEVQINGEPRSVDDGLDVARLVDSLGLARDQVAVERNREIVRRQDWEQVRLAPNDRLEIVHFVGGG